MVWMMCGGEVVLEISRIGVVPHDFVHEVSVQPSILAAVVVHHLPIHVLHFTIELHSCSANFPPEK